MKSKWPYLLHKTGFVDSQSLSTVAPENTKDLKMLATNQENTYKYPSDLWLNKAKIKTRNIIFTLLNLAIMGIFEV